ncbi:MAG TPA: hypothetical protein VN961_17080 [Streptosporangiaceae bacterium]|nr:hypothetical protein [Streptosporangiaceae bacterium]
MLTEKDATQSHLYDLFQRILDTWDVRQANNARRAIHPDASGVSHPAAVRGDDVSQGDQRGASPGCFLPTPR